MPGPLAAFSSLVLLAPPSLPDHGRIVRVAACDAAAPRLPEFVHLQAGLESVVQWTLEHSPTFREQCRVLSSATRWSVSVAIAIRPVGSYRRARGQFSGTPSGGITAAIEIYPGSDLPEMLGHEFEHLIEQMDGVDLTRDAKTGRAQRMDDGAFETARAVAAGRRVSGEVADNAPDSIRRAGGRVLKALRKLW
ncbi:MAG TPA: hypothetical protein VH740_25960 [Vicinamibacterales bacterium]